MTDENELSEDYFDKLKEQIEITQEKNDSENSHKIMDMKKMNIIKMDTLKMINKDINNLKDKMVKNFSKMSDLQDFIFKNFTEERIVIVKKDKDDSSYCRIVATNNRGLGTTSFWREDEYKKIEFGEKLPSDNRLTQIRSNENIEVWISIISDYDNIENALKKHITEFKVKRFKRFFGLLKDKGKELLNIEKSNWVKYSYKLDKVISLEGFDDSVVKDLKGDTISFDESLNNNGDYVRLSLSDNAEENNYSYRYGDKNISFSDLQRVEQVYSYMYNALLSYRKFLYDKYVKYKEISDELHKEFERELMLRELNKSEEKDK